MNKAAGDEARKRIEQITADIEPGQIFEGKVIKIMNFGADANRLALVRARNISWRGVQRTPD